MKYILIILFLLFTLNSIHASSDINTCRNYSVHISGNCISIGVINGNNTQPLSLLDTLQSILTNCAIENIKIIELYSIGDIELSLNSLFEFLGKKLRPEKLLLQHLQIDTLPSNIDFFTELKEIKIYQKGNISFPESVKNMINVKTIDYNGLLKYVDSNQIPKNINLFPSLDTLRLFAVKINDNYDFSGLSSLRRIIITDCKIRIIPESFSELKKLEEFFIEGCNDLKYYPCFISDLPSLRLLVIGQKPNSICKRIVDNKRILLLALPNIKEYSIIDSER